MGTSTVRIFGRLKISASFLSTQSIFRWKVAQKGGFSASEAPFREMHLTLLPLWSEMQYGNCGIDVGGALESSKFLLIPNRYNQDFRRRYDGNLNFPALSATIILFYGMLPGTVTRRIPSGTIIWRKHSRNRKRRHSWQKSAKSMRPAPRADQGHRPMLRFRPYPCLSVRCADADL